MVVLAYYDLCELHPLRFFPHVNVMEMAERRDGWKNLNGFQ